MGVGKTFVDTNVLVYAYNADGGAKQKIAKQRLVELWEAETGVVSVQVLQELYVTVTRKITTRLDRSVARELVRSYAPWVREPTGVDLVLRASEIEELHHLSFWDALVVASAHAVGAAILLSEDLNHGQLIEGVRIENPFLTGV